MYNNCMRFGSLTARTLLLTLAFMLPLMAAAQFGDTAGSMNSFSLSVSPQYPAPMSQATVSVVSSSLDLANATMTISVDGKQIYQGNARPVTVPIGKEGSITRVVVNVSAGGADYSQEVSIQPQDVLLVAEPVSSVPPLYPGKPSVPLEGSVRVVAIANLKSAAGTPHSPAALSYAWTVDTTQVASASGIGKATILVASPLQYRARTVSVAITSADGTLVGGASLSLSPEEPSLRIYENDPLLGIRFDRALPNVYSITGAEVSLYAAAFSLPTTYGAPFLQWFLDGDLVQTGSSITLRPTGSGRGTASLSLTAAAGQYTTASADLGLSFGAAKSSTFFGL